MNRHVLVVRPDNNGDVLLAGPAIRAVAAGADRVTLWVGARGLAAADQLPGVDQVVCATLPWIDPAPEPVDRAWLDAAIAEAARLDADAAIILTSFHQSPLPTALVLRAAGVSFIAAISTDYPGALLDVRHAIDDDVHEVERGLSLVRAAGFELPPADDGRLRVRDPGELRPWQTAVPYVVVHPGASVPARAWSADRFAATVDALVIEGWHVVVTGGADERDLTARVAGHARERVADFGGRTDWRGLAALIRGASAIVVGNTGPAHLAAAVGTPVVDVFAPVVPAVRWRPWRVDHVLLGDQDIACAGCRARVCPLTTHRCLDPVQPADVTAAVRALTRRSGKLVERVSA